MIEKLERAIDDIVAKMSKQSDVCNNYDSCMSFFNSLVNSAIFGRIYETQLRTINC
ncbi:hypothetical protein KsCSTR_00340 [Candidatus Kuenenia stuttgartiensis]|uniref:Uncharacterized protein n=1 Tax=Kuenenia stuttgartiensis TaxID=174633 RepID=A0A6G7GJC9_KUEST|nr:hypothetical protein KsCSTR_00340 [Candidatus Kuenenia stuttgartiensis]